MNYCELSTGSNTMRYKVSLAIILAALLCSPAVRAQSFDQSMENFLNESSQEAVYDTFCEMLISQDQDIASSEVMDEILQPIKNGGKTPICALSNRLPLVDADMLSSAESANPSLGADLAEQKNKWRWYNTKEGQVFFITMSNPYSIPISAILVKHSNGRCPSEDGKLYRINFTRPIEGAETVIVRSHSPIQDLEATGCLDIIRVDTKPLPDANNALSRVLPLAQAGQWQGAVLLSEAIRNSGAVVSSSLLRQLQTVIEAGVRPLPANDSVGNFRGYAALVALDRANLDYVSKHERYRAASVNDRESRAFMAAMKKLPFVNSADVFRDLSSKQTRAQRNEAWPQFQYKSTSIYGKVTDVRPAGSILPARIYLDAGDGNQVICGIKDFLADSSVLIRLGSSLTCSGKILEYTLILGVVTVSLGEAEFVQRP